MLNFSYEFYGSKKFKELTLNKYNQVSDGFKINFDKMDFDKEKKKWIKKEGAVRFLFMVNSKNPETGKLSRYQVTFLFEDFSKGFDSPIKIRVGSQDSLKSKRITNNKFDNIQSQFLFNSEFLYSQYGILYGRDRTEGKAPNQKNPKGILYLDKHSLWVIHNVLIPVLENMV